MRKNILRSKTAEKEENFDEKIQSYLKRYKSNGRPIMISFRSIVRNFNTDRATHLIHTYPAKLLPHIPYFFLHNNILSRKGGVVLDPFCGSGTVLLESILAGRNPIGADTNPLARLISTVKTGKLDVKKIKRAQPGLIKRIEKMKSASIPDVVNINYWFLPPIKKQLSIILQAIKGLRDEEVRDFFLVCFSNCVKKVSLADPRVSVPVKLRRNQYKPTHPFHKSTNARLDELNSINVLAKFDEIIAANIGRYERYHNLRKETNAGLKKIYNDSRFLTDSRQLRKSSVDLVISSPPYAGAQKYIRACSLSLGWLEFASGEELKKLDNLTIGRENYQVKDYHKLLSTNILAADKALKKVWKKNPLRAHIAANYLIEMKAALTESVRVLKKDGYFVLVAANNVICNESFKTQEYLCEILKDLGLTVRLKLIDDIRSYGLMTKRNKTASVITREWITVFQK